MYAIVICKYAVVPKMEWAKFILIHILCTFHLIILVRRHSAGIDVLLSPSPVLATPTLTTPTLATLPLATPRLAIPPLSLSLFPMSIFKSKHPFYVAAPQNLPCPILSLHLATILFIEPPYFFESFSVVLALPSPKSMFLIKLKSAYNE